MYHVRFSQDANMRAGILAVLPLVLCAICANGQTLCSQSNNLCPSGTRHIACESNGGFGKQCPANARAVTLSQQIRNLIVKMHNVRRNRVAGGNLAGYSTARRMPTIQWDDALARVALMNAKRCYMAHDKCRNTPTYARSGQNIGISGTSGKANKLRTHLVTTIQGWFSEYKDASMVYINSFSNPTLVGHFTLMVSDRVTRIGCGTVRYIKNKRNMLITTCNYSSTNIFNDTVYKTGTTASACTSGKNPNYPNLCSSNEPINVNAI